MDLKLIEMGIKMQPGPIEVQAIPRNQSGAAGGLLPRGAAPATRGAAADPFAELPGRLAPPAPAPTPCFHKWGLQDPPVKQLCGEKVAVLSANPYEPSGF